jgi:hypothetical protein
MKDQKINSVLNDIRFRTEVLESLGWDETQLNSLFLCLNDCLLNNLELELIMKEINNTYGIETFKIIKKLFEREALLMTMGFTNEN